MIKRKESGIKKGFGNYVKVTIESSRFICLTKFKEELPCIAFMLKQPFWIFVLIYWHNSKASIGEFNSDMYKLYVWMNIIQFKIPFLIPTLISL